MTASEAEEAVSKAEGLTKAMDAAEKLQGAQLDAEIAGLRQVHFRLCQSSVCNFFASLGQALILANKHCIGI